MHLSPWSAESLRVNGTATIIPKTVLSWTIMIRCHVSLAVGAGRGH